MSPLPYLIVDGYNVIRTAPRYSSLAESDIEAARVRLVEDVAAYSLGRYSATVVFDGGGNPESDGHPHHLPGVTVIFSRHGEDADTVIEGLARRARERGREAVVATSDAQTQWAVMGTGVSRMSSSELAEEAGEGASRWREHTPSGSTRGTLEDRLEESIRRKLFEWARGRRPQS